MMLTSELPPARADQVAQVPKRDGDNACASLVAAEDGGEKDVVTVRDMPTHVLSFGNIDLITSIKDGCRLKGASANR